MQDIAKKELMEEGTEELKKHTNGCMQLFVNLICLIFHPFRVRRTQVSRGTHEHHGMGPEHDVARCHGKG